LWSILSLLDREPALARVCVVQTLRGSQAVLERREEILSELAAVLDEGRAEGARGAQCPPLTAEGLVGAAFSIVYARLLRGDSEPLTGLHPELMGMRPQTVISANRNWRCRRRLRRRTVWKFTSPQR
jgi:hypothetical protein